MVPGTAYQDRDWPARPWVLASLLALCGLAIYFLVDDHAKEAGRVAGAAFFLFGGVAGALALDNPREWKGVALFSAVLGAVMGGLAYNVVALEEHVSGVEFSFSAGVFASLLALPLFQAGFHRLRFSTPYRDTHFHVWGDAISGAGALAFVGLSWLVLVLLAALFDLLKITLLKDLLDEPAFGWVFSGAAMGGALGVLRGQLKVLGTLQKVVMLVFGILAVPLAAGMAVFLAAVAVSGPDVLWQATKSATPLLLAFAAGSFVLVNAVVRDSDMEMSQSRIQRWAALVLVLGILPIAVLAAISSGARIAQHGLSPERIWAMIAVSVALAYGLAGLIAVVRGRLGGWAEQLRRANLVLAAGICVLALFLALPILDFGSISASNQVARLNRGAVSADDFDYAALRWDFGDAGRRELAALAKHGNSKVGGLARMAQASDNRYRARHEDPKVQKRRLSDLRTGRISDPVLLKAIEQAVYDNRYLCEQVCEAIPLGTDHIALVAPVDVEHFRLNDGKLVRIYPRDMSVELHGSVAEVAGVEVAPEGVLKVEVREMRLRQIFANGEPVGEPFK